MRHEFFTPGTHAFKPLTPEEERWVQEYLATWNASKASRRVGLSKRVAAQASGWLRHNGPKPHIARAVQAAIRARCNRMNITADAVVAELGRLGFSNMINYISLDEDSQPKIDLANLTPDTAAAIKKITVEEYKEGRGEGAREVRKVTLELHDKKAPLIALGKHLGLFGEGSDPMRNNSDPDEVGSDGQVESTQSIHQFAITVIPPGSFMQSGKLIEGDLFKEPIKMEPDDG